MNLPPVLLSGLRSIWSLRTKAEVCVKRCQMVTGGDWDKQASTLTLVKITLHKRKHSCSYSFKWRVREAQTKGDKRGQKGTNGVPLLASILHFKGKILLSDHIKGLFHSFGRLIEPSGEQMC